MKSTVGNATRPLFLALIAAFPRRSIPLHCSRSRPWASMHQVCQQRQYRTRPLPCPTLATLEPTPSKQGRSFPSKSQTRTGSRIISRQISTSTGGTDDSGNPRTELPSQEEGRRSQISKRFSHLMDHLQSNIFIAGQRLNDLTGYSGIEVLKKEIEEQEKHVQKSRLVLQAAREAYSTAINQRSGSQREVNELLQRKHAWTTNDLERFTALYRSDHANEQAESAAQEHLVAVERNAEEAATKLSASILARYHEEQIWSDKIRRMSTWGTWGLMGVNILLFLVFQIGVEPWRRKRLVQGFEDKVMEALEREAPFGAKVVDAPALRSVPVPDATSQMSSEETAQGSEPLVIDALTESTRDISAHPVFLGEEPTAPTSALGSLEASVRDLFSERPVTVRRLDLTRKAIECAAAGMACTGLIVLMILKSR